jgi:hypothetical protein
MRPILDLIEQTRASVSGHFIAIDDLMNDPRLAADFDSDLLTIYLLLNQIGNINDPIDDFHGRNELIESLQELREVRLAGLNAELQRLEQETS